MSIPLRRRWAELTTADFAGDVSRWVAILPVAATEQHGPHLPTGTDTIIGDRLIALAIARMPVELPAVILPTLPVGKSDEHMAFPGTLSLSARTLTDTLVEIGRSVARAGVRRLLIMSSHGGNSEAMGIAARELRLSDGMLVVATNWARLGQPEGLFVEAERRHGIHAGDIETSLMLALEPQSVRMQYARSFPPLSVAMEREFGVLGGAGPVSFAWATEDLHPEGACGDAAASTAAKGHASAHHAAGRFVILVGEMMRFEPPWWRKNDVRT